MHDHLRTADMSVFYMRDYVNYLKRLNDLDRAFLAPFSRPSRAPIVIHGGKGGFRTGGVSFSF